MKRTSQPLVWTSVSLVTAALCAGALKWIHFSIPIEERETSKPVLIDLALLEIQPAPVAAAELPLPPEPAVEPEPTPEELPPPKVVEAPPPEPPPVAKPEPPAPPKLDPAIIKRQREKEERARVEKRRQAALEQARKKEQTRQRELAKKRLAEKRRKDRAAKAARAAKIAAKRKREQAAKRIASKPGIISRRSPGYPSSARKKGHQGTTKVSFTVTKSGRVSGVRIVQSSGHRTLDKAAVSAVKKWRFKPARNGLGQAVPYTYRQSIPFQLK